MKLFLIFTFVIKLVKRSAVLGKQLLIKLIYLFSQLVPVSSLHSSTPRHTLHTTTTDFTMEALAAGGEVGGARGAIFKQMAEMKKKIQLVEGERKAIFEDSEREKEENKERIKKLSDEIKQFKHEVRGKEILILSVVNLLTGISV